jgi:hypothetical protein
VERITKQTTRLIPREAAPETLLDDSDEDEDDNVDDLYEDFESKPDLHPYRYRFWGLVSSPGDGSTAALVSQYSNYYPHRRGFCKLLFGSKSPRKSEEQAEEQAEQETPQGELTTEGKLWEWMYGGGAQVPGVTTSTSVDPSLYRASPQDSFFRDLRENQSCVFCDSRLQIDGGEARCSNNHTFGKFLAPFNLTTCPKIQLFTIPIESTNTSSLTLSHVHVLRSRHNGSRRIESVRSVSKTLLEALGTDQACNGISRARPSLGSTIRRFVWCLRWKIR